MLDTLIRAATIVDGTGAQPRNGDVGIRDGRIVAVGKVTEPASETLDADGALLTPGWVDVHTHYDGQVTWDDTIDPSASHGVTTVVTGNCGVGFAPVPKGGESDLIELMEGVEDIPGTALYEGMPWGEWETFPEYLALLDRREFALDVGTQLSHGALRNYVMGPRGRANEPATADDLARMRDLVEEAMRAGAVGFSSSRLLGHRSMSGVPVPGTFADEAELMALAAGMARADAGVFEIIPMIEQMGGPACETELELIRKIGVESGRPVTFTTAQPPPMKDLWKRVLAFTAEQNAAGANLRPQVASRPVSVVTSLQTYHLFMRRKTYLALEHLPLAERIREMRKPEVKAAILADDDVPPEHAGSMANAYMLFKMAAPMMFPITQPMDYEPDPDERLGVRAEKEGRPVDDLLYDFLLENDGKSFAVMFLANYAEGNMDVIHAMLADPNTISGLSDAGAHVNFIFDAVAPTYQLIHWVRDRTRGPRLPLEFIVHKQTGNNAELYGFSDRGTIEVGKRADLNVIDFENLGLGELQVRSDLPAGGSRILQPASGYIATFVNGVCTRENDVDRGARPGRVVRPGQP
jgi:N-acyl-D-aspartate/D-glutamate deacylase